MAIGLQAAAPPRLNARLFGDFRLQLAERNARPASRKAAALLAFLATLDMRGASRTRLADLLWGDRGEEQARSSLRQVIVELRASPAGVAGALLVSREMIGFAPQALLSDIDEIRWAAERFDAPGLAQMLEGLQDTLLADLGGVAPAFDDWLATERTRQEEQLFGLLLRALPDMIARSAASDTHRILSALERRDPLNEPVARLRLRLDHSLGDLAAVHRRYRRLKTDLARELGIGPSAETRALFDSLLAGAPDRRFGGDAGPPSPRMQHAQPARTAPVVLVDAFTSSATDETADLAVILTEDTRTALARIADLRVLMAEAQDAAAVRAAANNAIAAFRLSGRVRTIAGRTTVNVELGNIATGFVAWSEQLRLTDPPLDQIDDVVARIVGGVGVAVERDIFQALRPGEAEAETPREAAMLYALGRRLVREGSTLAEAQEGVRLLEEAIRQDPRHTGARLRLAQLYNTDFWSLLAGHDVAGFRARAFRLVQEAAALEPANVRVQLRLAWCHLRRGDWEIAERLLRATVGAMPHDADALNECAFGLACIGELDPAAALMQRAFELNPFAPVEYHADQAVLLALAGDARTAEEHFEVCAERRLHYQAVRLGNILRLDPHDPRLGPLQYMFVEQFLSIWQPQRKPELDDLREWLDSTLRLRRPGHRRLVLDGIEAAWACMSASNAR